MEQQLPAGSAGPAVEGPGAPSVPRAPASEPRRRITGRGARGEPMVWLSGGGLAIALLMVAGLLVLVLLQGLGTFWPQPVLVATLQDGSRIEGELRRTERYRPETSELGAMTPDVRAQVEAAGGWASRSLYRIGNFDLYNEDYRWVSDTQVQSVQAPADGWVIERREWGPWIGRIAEVRHDGAAVAAGDELVTQLPALLQAAHERAALIAELEQSELGSVNAELERLRLELRKLELAGEIEPSVRNALQGQQDAVAARYSALQRQVAESRALDARTTVVLADVGGQTKELPLSAVVRAYRPNAEGLPGKLQVYLSRWLEFLTEQPREANTEGGVLPALFGTLMMTVLMSLSVAPFGVMAALYLREYARQGLVVSGVRIAVNNLAGVPSIVYGVFGLGFFCYTVGGTIDQVFFSARLPSPTFGTGGILWASLTLALLTVPVVIVATEEALASVPRSVREGSYACGASRWQTIWRVVLPRASSGILTGLILAMARGAGEVAPLMLTGVVKLAPQLPVDGHFPFLHLERSFMHLGFHIYDVGFQSRNAEAGKPMVYTTTLLLIVLVLVLNLLAIRLRRKLRARFATSKF